MSEISHLGIIIINIIIIIAIELRSKIKPISIIFTYLQYKAYR
jgi:hypothetical protein